ncbi:MAG TPA: SGNH/GDSL hydrolase family protein [Verrucomicrobiae bacterium]|nr:SGNH/GDSL hydrolase family protein [Verrucomicrobiae bacterium]
MNPEIAAPVGPGISTRASPRMLLKAFVRAAIGAAAAILAANFIADRAHRFDDEINPVLGSVPAAAKFAWDHLEGDGRGYWTSNGVRRATYPAPSEGAPILLVGNSYTEAMQVTDEQHYGHLLEQELRRAGKSIPVLPFGRSGYSVADYIAQAQNIQALFHPKWVVIQVDRRDFEDRAWTKMDSSVARFTRSDQAGDIKVVPQSTPTRTRNSLLRRFSQRFPELFPYHFIYGRILEFTLWVRNERPWFHVLAKPVSASSMTRPDSSYPLDREVALLAEAYHHRLTLLYLPRFDPRNPAAPAADETTIRELAQKNGLRFVSLGASFAQIARSGESPFGFDNTEFNAGHWNRYGHAAAAQLLAADLLNMGL